MLPVKDVRSTANPNYTADELYHQLTVAKTSLLLVHPVVLEAAQAAAQKAGIPSDRVVLFERLPNTIPAYTVVLQDLVTEGLSRNPSFVERQLEPGEAKTKLAFLCFSSGTTGKPKVCDRNFGHDVSANIFDI
jgi:4-coumarate--CoA ligase